MEDWEIEAYEAMFGKYMKIVRMSTGEAFRVPVRDIVTTGVREPDLDQYPPWEEGFTLKDLAELAYGGLYTNDLEWWKNEQDVSR